jgi:hypothetical protein
MANPNPSPETRIGAPRGPKPGQTKEQVALARENAERAMRIRDRFLRAVEAKLNESDMDSVIEMLDAQALKLIKDSEDRGLGAPVQPLTSPDGSMSPRREGEAVLDALKRKHFD